MIYIDVDKLRESFNRVLSAIEAMANDNASLLRELGEMNGARHSAESHNLELKEELRLARYRITRLKRQASQAQPKQQRSLSRRKAKNKQLTHKRRH